MIILAMLLSIFAIGIFCWLLFTLAVFALPLFVGVSAGTWACHTGAGWLGAILVGLVAAALTFGLGQMLLVAVKSTWGRAVVAATFVAPALSRATMPPTASCSISCRPERGRPSSP